MFYLLSLVPFISVVYYIAYKAYEKREINNIIQKAIDLQNHVEPFRSKSGISIEDFEKFYMTHGWWLINELYRKLDLWFHGSVVEWAKATDAEKYEHLNILRRALLRLIYAAIQRVMESPPEEHYSKLDELFNTPGVLNILDICLPMDRENCLWRLHPTAPYHDKKGCVWGPKEVMAQWLKDKPAKFDLMFRSMLPAVDKKFVFIMKNDKFCSRYGDALEMKLPKWIEGE